MSDLEAVVFLVMCGVVLRFQLWRAVLFVRPQLVKVEVETPAEHTQVPPLIEDVWAQLHALGFVLLGAHTEAIPLRPLSSFVDGRHPSLPVVATLSVGPDEDDRLFLLTASSKGFVLTANYRRPSREVPGVYLSGVLEGATPERLLKAHLRRIEEIGPATPLTTLELRVEAARAWYRGPGKAELRQQHAVALLWTLGALGMVGAVLVKLLG